MKDFQTLILTLQNYWSSRGSLIWQPYHTEVGAGTMNPATFLRSLGPEPWNVAYVEPSIRPDDGRYGENPNRVYQHTQYQVIIKPDRGNSQELYLGSLEALGIDLTQHDIRFVEDNWAQPAISAWGLGWEVWLDGLEITQFTYFQQVGGVTLNPVAVELTYGLERIAMALQGVRDFKEIQWNPHMTYGDVLLQNEQETSAYAFETADVERLTEMFDLYEAEAKTCLSQNQIIPAHDYVLKCSHTFNILDTRGAIGVTERQGYFRRMRALARKVAESYVEKRETMGHPFLHATISNDDDPVVQQTQGPATQTDFPNPAPPTASAPFLLEIGVEELPPNDVEQALSYMRENAPALIDNARLTHDGVKIFATPRRITVYVPNLAPMQPDLTQTVKGPPANRAFDADGNPTRAAEGFARSKGLTASDLVVQEIDGGEYVTAVVKETGRSASDVLAEGLPGLLANLRFGKSMRWNASDVAFSRPIRWILALHGEHIVPFVFAGTASQNATRGLRFVGDDLIIPVKDAQSYFDTLTAQGILLAPEQRKATVLEQIQQVAAAAGGRVINDASLLTEVTHLVEAPNAFRGDFEPSHLELPKEVLISVMKKHQRYFPIENDAGELLPHFVVVANKPAGTPLDAIKRGNEDVVRARFADAAYFVRDDARHALADFVPLLDRLTFQAKLGSMLDKTRRLEGLTQALAPKLKLSPDEEKTALRVAALCKADLTTKMVVEMTSLQGVMGRHYALASGEPKAVAIGIFEHYLPRSADDMSPTTRVGLAVGLADRLDSLTGLFAADLAPTGNKDPFGLRRAAVGLVQNLIAWNTDFDLRAAIRSTSARLPIPSTPQNQADTLEFIVGRLRQVLLDEGYKYDVVDAVLAAQGHNPALAVRAVKELSEWVAHPDWDKVLAAYSRCVRITRKELDAYDVRTDLFRDDSEQALLTALETAEETHVVAGSPESMLAAFSPMIPAVDLFFEQVLVMDDDPAVRNNRLGLLQRVSALANGVADFSLLEGF